MDELIIKGIKRLNEYTDPELLEQAEVTVLDNLVLNEKAGKAVKRGGINIYKSATAGGRHYSVHDCVNSAGSNYILSAVGTKVRKLDVSGNTWSDLKTGLTSNKKTRITSYGDKYILVNGSNTPFITDLTSAWDLTISRPDVQGITSTITAGGSLTTAGTPIYRWMLLYVTSDGNLSMPSLPFGYSAGNDASTTSSGNATGHFVDLPVSSDTRVTGRWLFRTEANGTTYYFVASLDNTDTTYDDALADASLDTSKTIEYLTDIEYSKYVANHLSRIFLANVKTKYLTVTPPSHIPFTATDGDHGSAAIDAGTYKYKITFVDVFGRESEPSTYVEIDVDADPITYNEVVLTTMPRPRIGASPDDPNVLFRRIYRTKDGGSTYYWIADVAYNETSYTDITPDVSLSTVYPKAGSTLSDGSYTAKKTTIMFSNIGKVSEFPPENTFNIFPNDGDEITGIFSEPDGLLIFKTNSICKLYTQGSPVSWRVVKLVENIGCDNGETIVKAGNYYYFLNKKLVYRFVGNQAEPIGLQIKTSLAAVTTFYDAIYNIKRKWYILTGDDYLFIYDEIAGSWYRWTMYDTPARYCLCDKIHGSDAGTFLMGGDANEKILYYNSAGLLDYSDTSSDNDAGIFPVLRTKTFTFPDSNYEFRLRRLMANYKKADDNHVKHTLLDPDSGYNKYNSDTTNSTLTSDYKQYIKDSDGMSATGTALKNGKKLYYQIEDSGLMEFNSAVIKYRKISRGRRD